MWRVHCRLFGPEAEPRWFVVRDHADGMQYVTTPHGRPMPFTTEAAAMERAADMNAGVPAVTAEDWIDFDARR